MPKLTTQDLPTYYSMVNDSVPQAQQLRGLVSLLQTSQDKCNNQTIRDNVDMDTVLNYINLNLLQTKFDDKFVGPSRVFKALRNNTYLLAIINSSKPLKGAVNVDRLDTWRTSQVSSLDPVTQTAVNQYNRWKKTLLT
jgi:hypothetical protein